MRSLAIVVVAVAAAGTAQAGPTESGTVHSGPVIRVGAVGGWDSAAPGGREDGIALGAGYRMGGFTGELDYAYLDYDGTTGVGGGTTRYGVLLQALLLSATCDPGRVCTHLDLDVGAAERSIHWEPTPGMSTLATAAPIDRQGRELRLGASLTFGWHLALHYVLFQPDPVPGSDLVCRGVCPMQTRGTDNGLLLEVSFAWGG
jgi:hypothetical protein